MPLPQAPWIGAHAAVDVSEGRDDASRTKMSEMKKMCVFVCLSVCVCVCATHAPVRVCSCV